MTLNEKYAREAEVKAGRTPNEQRRGRLQRKPLDRHRDFTLIRSGDSDALADRIERLVNT